MLHYCKKCGRILHNTWDKEILNCDCCKSITYPVPIQYLYNERGTLFKNEESRQTLIEELVKTSPEFDPYLFEHRDEILSQKHAKFSAAMSHGKSITEEKNRAPKCPTCQSTNIRKMSGLETGTSVAVFGLFSRKINKTFKCNHCGYTW